MSCPSCKNSTCALSLAIESLTQQVARLERDLASLRSKTTALVVLAVVSSPLIGVMSFAVAHWLSGR